VKMQYVKGKRRKKGAPARERTKKACCNQIDCSRLQKKSGEVLLSHPVSRAVPSALQGLTSVFEMGTGVAPVLYSPKIRLHMVNYEIIISIEIGNLTRKINDQAARPISTGKLNSLLNLHIQPINLVVYQGSLDQYCY
jgi:hypothetical protein